MSGKQWGLMRLGMAISFALLVLLSVAGVMRESDQASLLDGAIQLARDGQLVRRGLYNYSVQYGSYWLLAIVFNLLNVADVAVSSEISVVVGNWTSALVFVTGVSMLLLRRGPRNWLEAIFFATFLLSPMVLLNGPLLSTNVISAGFLCLLVILLSGQSSLKRDLVCGCLGFATVSMRGDAILILPLISLLSAGDVEFRKMLMIRRLWLVFLGSVFALVLGRMVSGEPPDQYAAFFQPEVALTYFVFGLGANGLVFLLLVACLTVWGVVKKNVWILLVSVAAMIPLFFYSRLLMTPRHLMLTSLIPFFVISFEQGKIWLTKFSSLLSRKTVGTAVGFGALAPLLGGVELNSLRSGSLVFNNPTLYPTADGYWPMGCYGEFLFWLRVAEKRPIDHNQRVWEAWSNLDEIPGGEEGVVLRSNGLMSFGLLRSTQIGQRNKIFLSGDGDSLVASRYLTKDKVDPVTGERSREKFQASRGIVLSAGYWEELILISDDSDLLQVPNILRYKSKSVTGGNDYLFGQIDSKWDAVRGAGPFKWVFFRESGSDDWNLREVIAGREGWRLAGSSEFWVARSALPLFFHIEHYE